MMFLLISLSLLSFQLLALDKKREQTAFHVSNHFSNLDMVNVPQWNSLEEMQERFEKIRDKKMLSYEGKERRIPWLFPKDGCHTRAALFIKESEREGHIKPMRVFLFGVLEMRSRYIVGGVINPWFHSAPIVKVNEQVYVLDPSLDFDHPLTVEEWAFKMTPDFTSVNFSFCSGDTYLPTSNCFSPKVISEEKLELEAQLYLRFEWNTLKYLGYSPEELLL